MEKLFYLKKLSIRPVLQNSIYQKGMYGLLEAFLDFDYGIQIYSARKVKYWVDEFWRYLLNCSFHWQFSGVEL